MGVINQCRMNGKLKCYSLLQGKTKGQALGQVSFGRNSKRLFEFGHSHYVQYYQKNRFSTMVDAFVLMQHVVIQILTKYEYLRITTSFKFGRSWNFRIKKYLKQH